MALLPPEQNLLAHIQEVDCDREAGFWHNLWVLHHIVSHSRDSLHALSLQRSPVTFELVASMIILSSSDSNFGFSHHPFFIGMTVTVDVTGALLTSAHAGVIFLLVGICTVTTLVPGQTAGARGASTVLNQQPSVLLCSAF